MFFELNLILCSACLILNLILLLFYIQSYRSQKGYIEKFAILYLFFFLIGLLLFLLNLIFPINWLFQGIWVVECVAFSISVYCFFELMATSGESRSKKEKLAIGIYLSAVFIVIFIWYSLTIKEFWIEGHKYLGLDWFGFIGGTILFLIPEVHLYAVSIKKLFRIFEKKERYPLVLFLTILGFYLMATFCIVVFTQLRIYAFITLLGAIIGGLILNRVYPGLLVQIGSNFAFKRLYIVRNNGITLYSQEFGPATGKIKDTKIIQYLIGGVIYATTHGIKEIIKQEYVTTLRTMDFGKVKMIFHYGSQVLGILFTRETNTAIYNKLQKCIEDFELTFQKLLDQPTLNLLDAQLLSDENNETRRKIHDLLKKYFKF